MKESLLRFKNKQKYLIFDYETCNLNLVSTENKPWQLAFMLFEGQRKLDEADYLLSWKDLKVSKDAARITGFTKKEYDKRKSCPRKALDHFEKYLYDDSVIKVGHNVLGFDTYIHNIHRKLCKHACSIGKEHNCCETVHSKTILANSC